MHTAGTTGDHAPWSGRGAFLEVGAAVRTLVARLVTRAGGRPAPLGRPSGPSARARARSHRRVTSREEPLVDGSNGENGDTHVSLTRST